MPTQSDNPTLSHTDDKGHARMVDVSAKDITERIAAICGPENQPKGQAGGA